MDIWEVLGDGNIIEVELDGGCTNVEICQKPLIYTFKMVIFMLYVMYLNKAVFLKL
jgi:hypothetical protein